MKSNNALIKPSASPGTNGMPEALWVDVREMIQTARERVARQVDSALVTLYWNVGRRIRHDILKDKRAGYGQEILQALSAKLTVASYWTEALPKEQLERKLHDAVRFAREQLAEGRK